MVWSLYSLVQSAAPHGFLARRAPKDFEKVLEGATPGVAVGAMTEDRLVGYSVSRRMADTHPLARAFGFAAETAYEGMGSAIHPDVTGRLIMARMLALRARIEQTRGGAHVVGLIDIANLGSVVNVLRTGAVLVGMRRDETSLNYVAYGGSLVARGPEGPDERLIPIFDLAAQIVLFATGWAVTGLRRDGASRAFAFAPFPTAFGHLGLTDTGVPA
jgi:hypothetical protein